MWIKALRCFRKLTNRLIAARFTQDAAGRVIFQLGGPIFPRYVVAEASRHTKLKTFLRWHFFLQLPFGLLAIFPGVFLHPFFPALFFALSGLIYLLGNALLLIGCPRAPKASQTPY